MDKGTRVRIKSGRNGKGETGEIFWKGPNKWGEGERFGIRGDNGETYWVAEKDVEPHSGSAPEPEAGPSFAKGDRVRLEHTRESTCAGYSGGAATCTATPLPRLRPHTAMRVGSTSSRAATASWTASPSARTSR